MKDRDQLPNSFDTLPFREQDQLFATAALGFFLSEEYQTRIEPVKDERFLGSICKEKSLRASSVLYTGNTLPLPMQGYVYLRGATDLALGQLEERDAITYPLLEQPNYSRLRTSEKLIALEGVSALQAILGRIPVADWTQIRGKEIMLVPDREQAELVTRIDHLSELLESKTFTTLIPLWKDIASEEMAIIQETIQRIVNPLDTRE